MHLVYFIMHSGDVSVISNTNESLMSVSIESYRDVSVSLTHRICVDSVKGFCEIVVIMTYDFKIIKHLCERAPAIEWTSSSRENTRCSCNRVKTNLVFYKKVHLNL